MNKKTEVANRIGAWLAAALDDPKVCKEMKQDILTWMNDTCPSPTVCPPEVLRHYLTEIGEELGYYDINNISQIVNGICGLKERMQAETDKFKAAYMEWAEKSDFIRKWVSSGKLSSKYIGMHIADVMRDLIENEIELNAACEQNDPTSRFIAAVAEELKHAREKFPGDRIMTIALAEEFGELAKAMLDESGERVWKEAVQTAVMAARVAIDGDSSVDQWRAEKGLDNHRCAGDLRRQPFKKMSLATMSPQEATGIAAEAEMRQKGTLAAAANLREQASRPIKSAGASLFPFADEDDGPEFGDGCDHEGFEGGCERFGHAKEACPTAPASRPLDWLKTEAEKAAFAHGVQHGFNLVDAAEHEKRAVERFIEKSEHTLQLGDVTLIAVGPSASDKTKLLKRIQRIKGIIDPARYKHKVSGNEYEFVTLAHLEADRTRVVVYVSTRGGKLWVRPESEFFDGRFLEI